MEFIRNRLGVLAASLLYLLLGIVMIRWPGSSLRLICYFLGGITALYGAARLLMFFINKGRNGFYQFDLVIGIIAVSIGIFFLVSPELIVSVFPMVIGLFIIFHSFGKLQRAMELKRVDYERWWIMVVVALIMALLGILIIRNPFAAVENMVRAVGVVLAVEGAVSIISGIFTLHIVKKYCRIMEEASEMVNHAMDEEL